MARIAGSIVLLTPFEAATVLALLNTLLMFAGFQYLAQDSSSYMSEASLIGTINHTSSSSKSALS
jgi:hypothetical protein